LLWALQAGVEDESPAVLLEMPLDTQRPIDLVLPLCMPISGLLAATSGLWLLLYVRGLIVVAERGLRTGRCRSHTLTIVLST
jgi:hypothetical protein